MEPGDMRQGMLQIFGRRIWLDGFFRFSKEHYWAYGAGM